MSNPPLYLRPGRIGTVNMPNRIVRAATSGDHGRTRR